MILLTASPCLAANEETLITAKKMMSDDNTGIITAVGKVEISRNGYILHADKVSYNKNTNVMRAEGKVAILQPTGEVEFADQQEITGDMKQAFAENIAILFPDNSRFIARRAQRYEGRYMVAEKGAYTACNVCKENPDNPPLWQLRAEKITHDNVEKNIYYRDATIDFAGVPVLYTPYFSAPDPTVKRREGFLTATPGVSPNIGNYVKVPYYFDIAPNEDLVIAPTFSTEDVLQMGGEYRRRFSNGYMQFAGTVTHADLVSDVGANQGKQWRGHLFGNTLFNLDNVWRAGTDIAFTSDKSYLQRYRISSADQLTNRGYIEGFKGRDYAVSNFYYFQNLRPGTQVVQPLVLPEASFELLGEPGKTLGGRWSFGGNLLITKRDNKNQGLLQQGPDTRRISFDGGWQRKLVSDTGFVTTLSGVARVDTYSADNVVNAQGTDVANDVFLVRPFAQANVEVGYPIGRRGDGYNQLIEPLVSFTTAPNIKINSRQPNEDSLNVEFDETNLFALNRFSGIDLQEAGHRMTYGLRHAITADDGAFVEMFGGQSYSLTKNDTFPGLSGLRDHFSDYVGRIDFVPAKWLNLNYGFRLDHDTIKPQRQDANLSFGASIFRPAVRYTFAKQTVSTGMVQDVEEATVSFTSKFAKYWTLSGFHTQSLQPNAGGRYSGLGLSYTDECFIFGVTATRDNTSRADISSGTSVVFHLFLKNIGGVHTDSISSAPFNSDFREY